MDVPYYNQYGSLLPTDEISELLSDSQDYKDQERIFTDYISNCDSPYELWGIVFDNSFKDDFEDAITTTLDYIVKNRDRWDEDEMACFLLEVLTDHVRFGMNTSWIKEAQCEHILDLMYASDFLWDMFWQDSYFHLAMEIINHYQINEAFTKVLDERSSKDEEDKVLYYVAARMMEAGVLDQTPEQSSAAQYVKAMMFIETGNYEEAISIFLEFQTAFPQIMSQKTRILLAKCYAEIGWKGVAIDWILEALATEPENAELMELEKSLIFTNTRLTEKIEGYVRSTFHWTPKSLETLTQAEFLYRYHGRMLREHGPIISGYARAVEIHLREKLLPKLREWIEKYGTPNNGGRKYFRKNNNNRIYFDQKENEVSLETWSQLFDRDNPQQYSNTPGEFYYCIREIYGATVSRNSLSEFGRQLTELKDLRNEASHGSVQDWNKVRRSRELVYQMMKKLRTTTGSMI